LNSINYDPEQLKRFTANDETFAGHPHFAESYTRLEMHNTFDEFLIRAGYGAVMDQYFIDRFCYQIRNSKTATFWIKDPSGPRRFFVSIDLGEQTPASSTLLKEGESVEICWSKQVFNIEKKQRNKDPDGWPALVIVDDAINPGGSHLLSVTVPRDSEIPIQYDDEWREKSPVMMCYLRLKDSAKTAKLRLNGLKSLMLPRPSGVAKVEEVGDETSLELLQGHGYEYGDANDGNDSDDEAVDTSKTPSPVTTILQASGPIITSALGLNALKSLLPPEPPTTTIPRGSDSAITTTLAKAASSQVASVPEVPEIQSSVPATSTDDTTTTLVEGPTTGVPTAVPVSGTEQKLAEPSTEQTAADSPSAATSTPATEPPPIENSSPDAAPAPTAAPPPPSYNKEKLRDILCGASLSCEPEERDWFDKIPEAEKDRILSGCTPRQRHDINIFARAVPAGLLLMAGPPGSGKTTTAIAMVKLRLAAGDAVLGAASANSAVNNYFDRA
jgi:hypothetical protein